MEGRDAEFTVDRKLLFPSCLPQPSVSFPFPIPPHHFLPFPLDRSDRQRPFPLDGSRQDRDRRAAAASPSSLKPRFPSLAESAPPPPWAAAGSPIGGVAGSASLGRLVLPRRPPPRDPASPGPPRARPPPPHLIPRTLGHCLLARRRIRLPRLCGGPPTGRRCRGPAAPAGEVGFFYQFFLPTKFFTQTFLSFDFDSIFLF